MKKDDRMLMHMHENDYMHGTLSLLDPITAKIGNKTRKWRAIPMSSNFNGHSYAILK